MGPLHLQPPHASFQGGMDFFMISGLKRGLLADRTAYRLEGRDLFPRSHSCLTTWHGKPELPMSLPPPSLREAVNQCGGNSDHLYAPDICMSSNLPYKAGFTP